LPNGSLAIDGDNGIRKGLQQIARKENGRHDLGRNRRPGTTVI